ncbi:MAG: hypothetical protein M0P01_03090 [Treponema sp.]|nr:hypothetical protein [Treponema sp.]
MKTVTVIIVAAAFCAYALLVATLPLRRSKMLKKAGTLELPVKPRLLKFAVIVLVCCPLLILLVLFRDMGVFIDGIMCAIAILGTEMAIHEVMTAKCSGVYTNGIVAEGQLIPFSDIVGVPLLSLPENQQALHDTGVLDLVTKKRTNMQIIYSNEDECRRVIDKLVELEPRLNP